MQKKITKELLYYTLVLIILSLTIHKELLEQPAQFFNKMQEMHNYLHPFIWAFVVYLLVASFRWLFGIVMRLK
jgi:hypothetical protein